MKQTAQRYHDFSYGHRVSGHESKCSNLHGHNGRAHFVCEADDLDAVGRVIDFSAIKQRLCIWLEENWDHRFLAFNEDPIIGAICRADYAGNPNCEALDVLDKSIVWVPFNPTAENMAAYLLNVIGPQQLAGTGVRLTSVTVEETRKCAASASL